MNLAIRILLRELKSGDVMTLVIALILSVSTVTGIGLFVDRLQSSFELQSSTLLAADRVIRSSQALPDEWRQQAHDFGLATANRASFSSMVFSDDGLQLSQISAVTASYPLRGEYLVEQSLFGEGVPSIAGPKSGEIWVSSRLASLLNVAIGDSVQVGEKALLITAYLVRDPGSSMSAFAVAPRAVMSLSDLAATEIIQPGSRVRYALMMAGESNVLEQMAQWVTPKLADNQEWRTPRSGGQGIGATINRAESFLLLAGTLAVMMSGVAMALASNRYVKRHLTQTAVLKTLGATPNKIGQILFWQLCAVFALGAGIGLVLGWFAQELIALSLDVLLSTTLPPPSLTKVWVGLMTGLVSLVTFCVPLMSRLLTISPLTVLQPISHLSGRSGLLYLIGFAGSFALMVVYTGGVLLPTLMVVSVAVVASLVGSVGFGVFSLGRRLSAGRTSGWQIGLASLRRRLGANLFQLLVFTLIIMLGLILTGMRTSLISDWQGQIPENAPNHYLFNVQKNNVEEVKSQLTDLSLVQSDWYPMILGRVTHINGEEVSELFPPDTNQPEMLERELNLTWAKSLGSDNQVIEGTFSAESEGISIESYVAEEINIRLGDTLTLFVGGEEHTLPITSIRKVDWSSMQPNFYLILPQAVLENFPANYITSVFVPTSKQQDFYRTMSNYPTISLVNVGDLITRIQFIIAQVSQAILLVLVFIVTSGALVLVASVRASLDERLEEGALLRTLGASKQLIQQAMLIEFGFLGTAAGLIAAVAAEVCLFGLQVFVFELAPSFHPLLWILGPVFGFTVVTLIGVFAGRSVIKVPPMRMLRAL
ncbi:FtsX-like permease family protein [Marinomonas agarivorans]|nr:FtsX-like permease family protein [Marinomonas agarivorans]